MEIHRDPVRGVIVVVRHDSNDGSEPARAGLPSRESDGLIWVFTDPRGADQPFWELGALTGGSARRTFDIELWPTSWIDVAEQLITSPTPRASHHQVVAQLFRRWLQGPPVELEKRSTAMGFKVEWSVNGPAGRASLEWIRPNAIHLRVRAPNFDVSELTWAVPVHSRATRLLRVMAYGADCALVAPAPGTTTAHRAPTAPVLERFRRWHLRHAKHLSAPPPPRRAEARFGG